MLWMLLCRVLKYIHTHINIDFNETVVCDIPGSCHIETMNPYLSILTLVVENLFSFVKDYLVKFIKRLNKTEYATVNI